MFKPVDMLKINVLVLGKYLDRLTVALGDSGLVHLVNAPAQSRQHLLTGVDTSRDIEALEHDFQKCAYLIDRLGIDEKSATGVIPAEDKNLEDVRELLREVDAAYQEQEEAIDSLMSRAAGLRKEQDELAEYPLTGIRAADLQDLDFLYVSTGQLAPTHLRPLVNSISEKAVVLSQENEKTGQAQVLILAPRKNRWALQNELRNHAFDAQELPPELDRSVGEELDLLEGRLRNVREELERHRERMKALGERYGRRLRTAHRRLAQALTLCRAKQKFGKTQDLYCISGWIPRHNREHFENLVERVTGGTAVIEAIKPDEDALVREGEEQVPVLFASSRLLAPFQKLVAGFGAPRYQEVEPSIFVALSFVVMFGIMFGDVGQGAVIAAAGLFVFRSHHPFCRKYRDAGYLLLFCGAAAVVFGFLYGSIFGYEKWLPRLWVSPLHDIMGLLKVAIGLGIVCISVGIIINIVNKFRARDYFQGIFDKFGIIGVLFYWGSIGLGLKAAVAGRLSALEVLLVSVLPLAILFLREPLYNLLRRRRKLLDEDVFSYVMESAVEVMETITVFLGSTVSFVRVGAFALSHAALCLAIYSVVDVLKDTPASGLWMGAVIVFGNLFVILLEGLVVMIQGIRLEYYELFSKYFPGDGVLYEPFQLMESGNEKSDERTA